MAGIPPNTLRDDEGPEYPFVGPFGGIQSEVAVSQIGRTGFAEVQNLIFRLSQAQSVPGFTAIQSPEAKPIQGIGDFFNQSGNRLPVVWTTDKMYKYDNATPWTEVTGAGLTGNASQFFSEDVVGYKIYFCQGKDKIGVWDGITAGYTLIAASVPAKYVCEYDTHLLIANTIEAGPVNAANRIRWSGAGDGTDWSSFSSGQTDLFNALGPINGLARLYQSAFAFQQWGITQIVRTGIGTAPFAFIPLGSKAKGSILPNGVASFGEAVACYVGKDDIYIFDGTNSYGIGAHPIDGNRRLGARQRIFSDLFLANQFDIFGFILTTANGFEYESYWLFIPFLNKAWVYHFDEQNWTQVFFTPGQLQGPVGEWPLQQVPRIMDLVGQIQAQSWTPATLVNANQLDTMVISDALTNSLDYFNFGAPTASPTSGSINANDGWYIRSGQLTFDDTRHEHNCAKVRVCLVDQGQVTLYLRVSDETGTSQTESFTVGTGSGNALTFVQDFTNIHGQYITWELSGPQDVNTVITEITPYYDISGEVKCG